MPTRPAAPGRRDRLMQVLPGRRTRQELAEARETVRRLRRRVRQLSRRVETLQRRVRRLRPRDDLGYVFVMTYGRSGSTLLQGVLNSIPGYLIRGENWQALTHVHDFHRLLVKERGRVRRRQRRRDEEVGGATSTHPFYGLDTFSTKTSLAAARRLALDTLLRPRADTRVTGFKEIRWVDDDVSDYVAWLRQVFPGARFVVNTRDLDAVARSEWWAEMPDARTHLAEREQRLLDLAEELGDAAFRVHYDDYAADPEVLRPLFAWLGEEFDEDRVRAVLEVRHSF